jgi:hypothetical protein
MNLDHYIIGFFIILGFFIGVLQGIDEFYNSKKIIPQKNLWEYFIGDE